MGVTVLQGDCREVLTTLPAESVQCVVTSPPYFGLRSYSGGDAEIGMEETPAEYVATLVEVFREVRRVLHPSGVVWLNLGDSYAANRSYQVTPTKWAALDFQGANATKVPEGMKPKDLMMIPARAAIALCEDGWYLRADCIWSKPNCQPESVMDRPTRSHEHVFLLAKSEHYFYDAAAIREEASPVSIARINQPNFANQKGGPKDYKTTGINPNRSARQALENFAENPGRNKRDVWIIPTFPTKDAHFAVFPEALIEPCILAGSKVGDTILDPFAGSGTTLRVATKHRRNAIGIELNSDYCDLIEKRTSRVQQTLPMEEAV